MSCPTARFLESDQSTRSRSVSLGGLGDLGLYVDAWPMTARLVPSKSTLCVSQRQELD